MNYNTRNKPIYSTLDIQSNLIISETNNCDIMGQNQSHVAKHKRAEICISENVKLCSFFVFIKNKIFV